MPPTDDLLQNLRAEIAQGRVLAIIGAGVSIDATKGHPHASWTGLIESGIESCLTSGCPIPDGWEQRLRKQIHSGDLRHLLAAAQEISLHLGAPDGGEYRRWFRETVGLLPLLDRTVLEALRDLRVPLATTNYDGLIEKVTGLDPVTWQNSNKIERVLRGEEEGVLHLHGFWDEPESVVLGLRSYDEISGDAHAQAMLRALRSLRSFLFVGCGEGLADPNFGAFLHWSREVFSASEARHFRLCRTGEVAEVQALHPPEERIFALPYGLGHGDLVPFLRALAPSLTLDVLTRLACCLRDSVCAAASRSLRLDLAEPSRRRALERCCGAAVAACLAEAGVPLTPLFSCDDLCADLGKAVVFLLRGGQLDRAELLALAREAVANPSAELAAACQAFAYAMVGMAKHEGLSPLESDGPSPFRERAPREALTRLSKGVDTATLPAEQGEVVRGIRGLLEILDARSDTEPPGGWTAAASKRSWSEVVADVRARFPEYEGVLRLPERPPILAPTDLDLPSPYFTGRQALCDGIYNALAAGEWRGIFVIHGLAGIGKSEVARQIVWRLHGDGRFPDGYLWLNFENLDARDVWTHLAARLHIGYLARVDRPEDQLEILRIMLQAIRPLVILDGANAGQSLDRAFQALRGQTLLITSHRPQMSLPAHQFEVAGLDPESSINLFLRVFRSKAIDPSAIPAEDRETLRTISERLAGHPLCLDILASVSARCGRSYEEILLALDRRGIQMIALPDRDASDKAERHRAINKTFDLALDQDLSYSGLPRSLVRTLLAACGAVAGEYFYFEELRSVLQTYLRLFLHEIDQERERAKTSQKAPSHIMRFLKLETEASALDLPPVPQVNAQGVPEVLHLLTGSAELEQIRDALVAASILRVGRVPGDSRVRYRLHPLLREYALSMLSEYLTAHIWKAVAEWNAFKARHLAGDPGEQLPNLLFYLSVCRRRSLHQEYGTILLSLVPYLQRHGMWTRERELLEEARSWFENDNDPAGFLAPVYQHLGDLQQRLGDTRSARTALNAAREGFDRTGNLTMCCWIDYWLASLEEDQRTSEQVRRRLYNLRKAAYLDLPEVAAAELRAVLDTLDPHLFSNLHASSNEFLLESRPLSSSHSNFSLKGELLARARAAFFLCDFTSAGELLSWVDRIQAHTYDVETASSLLRQQALLEIEAGDLAVARERQQQYWDIEGQLGRQRQSREENAFIEGRIELAGGRLEAAQAAFANAKHHDLWLLCDLLLRPLTTLGYTEALAGIEEELTSTTLLARIAFLNGLIAAHRARLGDQSSQQRFAEALAFLRKRQYIDGRLLVRLGATEESEGPADCPAEEAFVHVAAARAPFPVHLPTRLRSREGREMLLVPAGASTASNSGEMRWVGAFYLDQQPVTFGEFKTFLAASGSEPPSSWGGTMPPAELDQLPVRGVSYQVAARYADWAGKVLPTLHELRRAARLAASPEHPSAPDALARQTSQWLTESFKALEQPSAVASVALLLDSLGPELPEGDDSPYRERPPWNDGLPHPADAAAFVFGAATPPLSAEGREKLRQFLHLLSGSLWMDDREKLQILDSVREYGLAELNYVLPDLYEEEIWLLALRPKPDTRLDRLIRFRRQQWRSLAQRRSGVEPDCRLHAEDEACRHFQPHDLARPLTETLPAGFDLEAHLDPSLSPRERRTALDFLSHLAATSLLTKEQKIILVSGLANGIDDIDGDLGKHMFLEREQMTRARSFLARYIVHLDQKWQEWQEIAATLPAVCQGGGLFRNKLSILAGLRETANPYQTIVHWNDFDNLGVEISQILPGDFNRSANCDRFLTLLSNSISLDADEKLKILDAMPRLTEFQVKDLMDILDEERGKYGELDRMHWPQLEQLFELSQREWHSLVDRLATEDANPFSALELWDSLIAPPPSLHDLYSSSEMSDERRLLIEKSLHYLFMSIQLTADDKAKVLPDLPRRSKEQLEDLLDVLRAEIERYREYDRPRWHVLYLWREKCNAEWIDLVQRRISRQSDGETPPEQGAWHAHLDSPPDATAVLGIAAKELDGDHFLELMQASISLDFGVKLRLVRGVHLLSPADNAELTAILEIERRYLEELGGRRSSCLARFANRAREQWPQVISSALEQNEREEFAPDETADADYYRYHDDDDDPGDLPDGPESPFADQPPCDHGLPESLDLRDLLPPHPDTDLPARRFLQLLSASLSRSREEKEAVLAMLPTFTQGKINQLLDDLREERRQLLACPQEQWLELRYECEKSWDEWRQLVTSASPRLFHARYLRIPGVRTLIRQRKRPYDENLSGLDFTLGLDAELAARGHPFAGPHPCDSELPPDLDVRDLLPQHPGTLFAERDFLQLLAGSVSLTGDEKSRIIDAVPRLTQFQIDALIGIILEERRKFNEIGEEHLPQLRDLATLHWIEWVDVAYGRQPSLSFLSRLPSPVDVGSEGFQELGGKLWHWTSSRSKDSAMVIAAGHSAHLPYTDSAKSTPFDFLRSILEAESERLTCGFRCCLPIFSTADLENFDARGKAGATALPRSAP